MFGSCAASDICRHPNMGRVAAYKHLVCHRGEKVGVSAPGGYSDMVSNVWERHVILAALACIRPNKGENNCIGEGLQLHSADSVDVPTQLGFHSGGPSGLA